MTFSADPVDATPIEDNTTDNVDQSPDTTDNNTADNVDQSPNTVAADGASA